ncbi:fluoride efflux transporter CrcB [Segetibacter aerophilus]|uniref:Fluoride-specific ion channel FluC n=1 Tax=Segetibacter aerophilus TaxID=670293 RepID=A0A512BFN5_9BACT|nr:fluoride efflux transporter CrcB [Segetibacter aerophilus]GEO10772.1 putative fluoride ion transporter CrcB [Segetibacter aerophilus]
MKTNLILIGLGGALGSIVRYLVSLYVSKQFSSMAFPYGTFAVNVIGCVIIGIVYGMSERFHWLTPTLRLFLVTGFCGGFTTFSAFAYENLQLLQSSNYTGFALYTTLSFIVCIIAVFLGSLVVKIV